MFLNSSKDAQKPEQIPNGLATSDSASELQVVPQRAVPMEDEERSEVSVFNFEPESLELVFPSALTQRQGHSPHKLTSWPSDSSLTSGYLSDELNSPKQSILEDEPPLSPPRVLLDISTPFQQAAPGTGLKIRSVSSCCCCFFISFLETKDQLCLKFCANYFCEIYRAQCDSTGKFLLFVYFFYGMNCKISESVSRISDK